MRSFLQKLHQRQIYRKHLQPTTMFMVVRVSSSGARFWAGLGMAVVADTIGAGFLASETSARAQDSSTDALNRGDTAILRLLAAVELIEVDLWVQYAELGGLTSG